MQSQNTQVNYATQSWVVEDFFYDDINPHVDYSGGRYNWANWLEIISHYELNTLPNDKCCEH